MSLIHDVDPYEGFDASAYDLDLQDYASSDPRFGELLGHIRPSTIIEVGSWKGASAIHMARIGKMLAIPGLQIVCVDTWLGSGEHWKVRDEHDFFPSLRLHHGYPTVYYQFVANVLKAGHADVIVPLPLSSVSAADFLRNRGVVADFIYLDAGHSYLEARVDLEVYWPLLRKGGGLLCDDYDIGAWPGVVKAVDRFATRHKLGSSTFQVDLRMSGSWAASR
jgi:hypothetical protein